MYDKELHDILFNRIHAMLRIFIRIYFKDIGKKCIHRYYLNIY